MVKEYKDFTQQEKDQSQHLWERVLNDFCRADEETGCRPCDLECPCDKCQYDEGLNHEFAHLCVEENVPITPREAGYL